MRRQRAFRLVVAAAAFVTRAHAQPVGDIQVFYDTVTHFGHPTEFDNLDGPVFVIENTSGSDITDGVLSIGPGRVTDSFHVGTVPAGGRVFVAPGVSGDGSTRHTFFRVTGSLLDTSENGPNENDTQFEFTGMVNAAPVDSGVFTPMATRGPSNDDTVTDINFLGGPGNADGPCNDCFGPKVVAILSTGPTTCRLRAFPMDSLAGVECAMDTVRGTLAVPLQPDCTRHCRCKLTPALDRIATLVGDAGTAARRKRCQHKLAAARRAARSFANRVLSLGRRRCLVERATLLGLQAADLAARVTALSQTSFCAVR